MTDLVLYTNPRSRGRTARWMLEETGVPYRTVVVDYGPAMRAPAYLAINPMGKVPALVHDGQVVTELAAICAYLAAAFPEAELGPRAEERAAYFRALFFAAGPLEQAVTLRVLGLEVPPEKQGFVGFGSFERMVAALEALLGRAPFAAGGRFTAADVVLGGQVGYGLAFGTLPKTPLLEAYWARVSERPARARAAAADDALVAA